MRKRVTLLLIAILAASSLLMVEVAPASAQSKPSVPEFTVEFAGRNLELKIKNQPFVPYYDDNMGRNVGFYYNIHVKLHSSDKWVGLYNAEEGYLGQSDSEYTTLILGYLDQNGLSIHAQNYAQNREVLAASSGDQVDFQVEAMIGNLARAGGPPFFNWELVGDYSGWSRTQTVTVPTPSPAPTPSLATPERANALIGLVILALVVGSVSLLIYVKTRNKQSKPKQSQLSKWQ
jgi:hypothetical protein